MPKVKRSKVKNPVCPIISLVYTTTIEDTHRGYYHLGGIPYDTEKYSREGGYDGTVAS